MRARYEDSSGPWSDEATQRIQSSPPAAPTGLNAVEVSDSSITLSWTAPSSAGITGYRVLRGLTAAKQDVLANNTGSTETEYVDSDVEAGTQYHYSVRAINAAGVGTASETITVTTNDQAVNPRQNPTNRPPKFRDANNDGTADPATVTISEHAAPGTTVLNHATIDLDNDVLTYSVSGTDAAVFAEAFRQHTGLGYISVKNGTNLDYETKASYSIKVNVTDSKDADDNDDTTIDDSFDVTINVDRRRRDRNGLVHSDRAGTGHTDYRSNHGHGRSHHLRHLAMVEVRHRRRQLHQHHEHQQRHLPASRGRPWEVPEGQRQLHRSTGLRKERQRSHQQCRSGERHNPDRQRG